MAHPQSQDTEDAAASTHHDGDDNVDDGDDNEVTVDNFKFAADDQTVEVPHPATTIMVLPRHLRNLVDLAGAPSGESSTSAADGQQRQHPLRLIRAPHPRHGEPIWLLGASFSHTSDSNTDEQNGGDPDLRLELRTDAQRDSSPASAPCHQRMRLYEMQSRRPQFACWFVGDAVEPLSPLYIVSPLHPAFIALRLAVDDVIATVGRDGLSRMLHDSATMTADSQSAATEDNNGSAATGVKFRGADDWTARANRLLFVSCGSGGGGGEPQRAPFPDVWSAYLREGFEAVCEVKAGGGEAGGGETYYRLCGKRTRQWMLGRFGRLMRCRALERLVFGTTSATTATTTTAPTDSATSPSSSSNTDAPAAAAAAPTSTLLMQERALGLLLEYVTSELPHSTVRQWLLGAARASVNILAAKAVPASFSRDDALLGTAAAAAAADGGTRDGDTGEAAAKRAGRPEVATTAAMHHKGASVKRLEKAGAPKGTPSIMSFFSVKKPAQ